MHGMLNSIDAAAAAEAVQMLEGAVEARELLQGMIDKISGATQLFGPVIVALGMPDAHIHPFRQILVELGRRLPPLVFLRLRPW